MFDAVKEAAIAIVLGSLFPVAQVTAASLAASRCQRIMVLTGSLVKVRTGYDLQRHATSPGKNCEGGDGPPVHAKFVCTTCQCEEKEQETEFQEI